MQKQPKKILFVCLGNICRSAAAEGIANGMIEKRGLQGRVFVDSAGLHGYHEGELADPRMRAHAERRGYKLLSRSRPVTTDDFFLFDLIVAMDESNVVELYNRAPTLDASRKIVRMMDYASYDHGVDYVPDPYYGGAKGFDLVLDILEDTVASLLDKEG